MTSVFINIIIKYKKIPLPAKASIWFVVCSIMQKGISYITIPIFTRLLTEEQYGVYSTFIAWSSILVVFTSLNLYYGVFNNAMVKFENQRERYISSMQGLVTLITLLFFFIYLIFKKLCNELLGMTTPLVILLFFELLFTPALQFWTVHNRFEYRYKSILYVTLLKSILNPLLGFVLVIFSEHKDVARIFSVVLIEVIICGTITIYQFYKGKCFFDKEFWKYAVVFNIPLIPHYLSGTILNQGDRVMISKIVGDSAVAFYSVAYNLAQIMNIFTTAIVSSFTPWVYRELKEKRIKNISRVINLLFLLMAGLITLLMLLAPEALYVLGGPNYAEAVYVIPPIAASVFFIFIYNIFSIVEFYFGYRKFVTIGSVIASCANLVLNGMFIPYYGYYAAGYTTLFCYIIYGLSHIWFSKIVVKKYFSKDEIVDVNIVLWLSALIVILAVIQNVLVSHPMLRYVIVIILIIILITKRKVFISEFKRMHSK